VTKKVNKKDGFERVTAVVPYYHVYSNHLKALAATLRVCVVYAYPNKLGKLTCVLNQEKDPCVKAISKHQIFVKCKFGCVYAIPFSCGRVYVGQSGRCINCRLTEHKRKVSGADEGISTAYDHADQCGCEVLFDQTKCTDRIADRFGREVVEAWCIQKLGNKAVSVPSVRLGEREYNFVEFESAAHLACLRLGNK
jgi:hypothetical protein